MAVFYDNNFIQAQILEDDIITFQYLENVNTDDMSEKEYKACALAVAQKIEDTKTKKYLIDKRYGDFIITTDLQEWIATEITPKCLSVKKMAILVSSDLFVQVSIEQLVDEIEERTHLHQSKFFEDYDKAIAWLNI